MPNHRVEAEIKGDGIVKVTAKLGDLDRGSGGSGRGTDGKKLGIWSETLKYKIAATFISFQDGRQWPLMSWEHDPKNMNDHFEEELHAGSSMRGVLSLAMSVAEKSSSTYDLYTTTDVLIAAGGP